MPSVNIVLRKHVARKTCNIELKYSIDMLLPEQKHFSIIFMIIHSNRQEALICFIGGGGDDLALNAFL